MDWQIVVAIIISVGAVLAYFAMGEDPEARVGDVPERKVPSRKGSKPELTEATPALMATPVRLSANDETIRRFAEAFKSQG